MLAQSSASSNPFHLLIPSLGSVRFSANFLMVQHAGLFRPILPRSHFLHKSAMVRFESHGCNTNTLTTWLYSHLENKHLIIRKEEIINCNLFSLIFLKTWFIKFKVGQEFIRTFNNSLFYWPWNVGSKLWWNIYSPWTFLLF